MPYKNPDDKRRHARERARRVRAAERAAREAAEREAAEMAAAARAAEAPPGGADPVVPSVPPVDPVPIRTAADALAVVAEQLNAARADPTAGVQTKARTVGYLVSAAAVKLIEMTDLAERVATLEARLADADEPTPRGR